MGSKGTQTTTQNTTTAPNDQAMAAYQSLLQQAAGVASTPYQAYTGELVAPVNAQENTGIAGVNANANYAQPYYNSAIQQAQTASQPLTAAGIQQYMSPYTQNVVDATQAQFNNQNQQALQQVKGNAIAQGALGGNREAVAEANTLGQLQTAQAPTIANLYNQGYTQAVNTAQQQQALGLQGANSIGSLAGAGQTAGLSGATTQIGAGQLQQNTQNALDQALLQQYQLAQAYPYQNTQWLAGIDTGVGSQMGGTSSGTTTSPAPSLASQLLGGLTSGVGLLGATGAFGSSGWLLSDKRAKENIKVIGKTNDGQKIYRFNYKGDPETRIGFLAQETEKKHPHAVHEVEGVKFVDYKAATDDAVKGRASGGGVAAYPWGQAQGSWIPQNNISHGQGAPQARAPAPYQDQSSNLNKQAASIGDIAKQIKGSMDSASFGGGNFMTDAWGGSSSNPLPGLDASDYGAGYARGGVAAFADGGVPTFDERFDAAFPNYNPNGVAAIATPAQDNTVVNPDDPLVLPDPQAVEDWRQDTDNTNATANSSVQGVAAPSSSSPSPSSNVSSYAGDSNGPSTSSLPSEITNGSPDTTTIDASGVAPATGPRVDWGADSKLWPSLISAGFGMMSSRSPYLGVAIGEGGQAGVASYNAQQKADFEAQKFKQQQIQQQEDMNLKERADARAQQLAERTAATSSLIPDGNGGYKINPTYLDLKRQEANITQHDNWAPVGSVLSGGDVHPLVMNKADGSVMDAVTGKPPQQGDKVSATGRPGGPDPAVVAKIVNGITSGKQPPSLTGLYGMSGPVRAGLDEAGFDLVKAQNEETAAKKQIATLNGPQMTRFVTLARSVSSTIDEVRELSKQLQNSGVPILNRAKLAAYMQTAGNTQSGQLAARYIGAVNTLKEEFANLANGGYAPTEAAWKLANDQINGDYGVKQLGASLDEVQRLINYRVAAIPGLATLGPGAANRYTGQKQVDLMEHPHNVSPAGTPPSLQQFLDRARIANPNISDADLTAYYQKKYGTQ